MNEVIIHVGYPKTGTKALQRHFFPKHPNIFYLGQPFVNENIKKLVEQDIMQKDMIEYDETAVRENFLKEINNIYNNSSKKILLSTESLSYSLDNQPDRTIVAQKLSGIFGNAKIIITIRSQLSFISSIYKQAVYAGLYMNFQSFLTSFWQRYHCSFFPQLKYYEFIKIYERIFGRDNILLLCYEEFKNNPQGFLRKICRFAGISTMNVNLPYENIGLSKQSLLVKRLCNRIIKYNLGQPHYMLTSETANFKNFRLRYRNLTKHLTKKIDKIFGLEDYQMKFSSQWHTRLTELYSASNKKIYEEYGIDIKKYSYPLK